MDKDELQRHLEEIGESIFHMSQEARINRKEILDSVLTHHGPHFALAVQTIADLQKAMMRMLVIAKIGVLAVSEELEELRNVRFAETCADSYVQVRTAMYRQALALTYPDKKALEGQAVIKEVVKLQEAVERIDFKALRRNYESAKEIAALLARFQEGGKR